MLETQKKLTNTFYALLSLPATAMGFALSIQISALSWILSTQYNLKIDEVGLVWAAGPLAGILGQVIIGVISDKVWLWGGRRRPFILIGGIFASLMLLALPNIKHISDSFGFSGILGMAIAIALTLDLAINISFNPTRSIIADITPEGVERTKGYTWMQTVSGTFGVLAYVIGAVWGNYVLIYFGVFLVFLLSVIPTFFITEPKELKAGANDKGKSETVKTSFTEILLLIEPLWGFLVYAAYAMIAKMVDFKPDNYYIEAICFIITIVFILKTLFAKPNHNDASADGIISFKKILAAHTFTWLGIQTMFVYIFAFLQHKVFLISDNSLLTTVIKDDIGRIISISFLILNAVAALLPTLALEPIARKIGRVRTHFLCIASMAISYALMLVFGFSALNIYIIMALLGIGWASTISLPFAIMSQQIDQRRMGLFMGLFNLSVVLPQLVASFGVGQVVNSAGDKNIIFIISALSLGISALLWMLVKNESENKNESSGHVPSSH